MNDDDKPFAHTVAGIKAYSDKHEEHEVAFRTWWNMIKNNLENKLAMTLASEAFRAGMVYQSGLFEEKLQFLATQNVDTVLDDFQDSIVNDDSN